MTKMPPLITLEISGVVDMPVTPMAHSRARTPIKIRTITVVSTATR
jgi:hypothetical protein